MVKEKRTDFWGLIKDFFKADEPEVSDKDAMEIALADADISAEDKKLLLNSLKSLDKYADSTFNHSDKKMKKEKLKNVKSGYNNKNYSKTEVNKGHKEIEDREIGE